MATKMGDEAWQAPFVQCLGVRLAGDLLSDVDEKGDPIKGDTVLLLINAHWEQLEFKLPKTSDGDIWQTLIDTAEMDRPPMDPIHKGPDAIPAVWPFSRVAAHGSPGGSGRGTVFDSGRSAEATGDPADFRDALTAPAAIGSLKR